MHKTPTLPAPGRYEALEMWIFEMSGFSFPLFPPPNFFSRPGFSRHHKMVATIGKFTGRAGIVILHNKTGRLLIESTWLAVERD